MSILHALAHAQHYKILLWLNFFFWGFFFTRFFIDWEKLGKWTLEREVGDVQFKFAEQVKECPLKHCKKHRR